MEGAGKMGFLNLSPAGRARREADLERMRERFSRYPTHRQAVTPKAKFLTARELAHAIRIAIKDAKQRVDHNPLYVEALEIAASYFDEIE
jgi:hypothetical protein